MKKVTLILSDKIQLVIGSSRGRRVVHEDLSPANITRALCDRTDYHQYFCFESPDNVKVVSIVDHGE
jgi:hypothetical protein